MLYGPYIKSWKSWDDSGLYFKLNDWNAYNYVKEYCKEQAVELKPPWVMIFL